MNQRPGHYGNRTLPVDSSSIVDDMPGMLCRFTLDGEILFVNAAYASAFGRAPQDMIGERFLPFIPPEHRARVMENIRALTPSAPVATQEHPVVASGGVVRWQRWINRLLCNEHDVPVAYQSFGIDITDVKRAEVAVERERQAVSEILNGLAALWYAIDQEGRFVRWNRHLLEVTGYTDEEVAQASALDFIHPRHHQAVAEAISRGFAEGETRLEADLLDRDGNAFPYLFTGRSIYLDARLCLVGMGIDISDRRRMESSLRQSERRYRSFIETTTDGVFSFEPKAPVSVSLTVPEQVDCFLSAQVVTCSDACARMYGRDTAEDLVGTTLAEMHRSAVGTEYRRLLEQWIAGHYRISDVITSEQDAYGNERWFSNSVMGVVENGFLRSAWGTRTDVTDRKTAERRLRLAASVFEGIAECVFVTDPEHRIIEVNRAFTQVTGYELDAVEGQDPDMLHTRGYEKGETYHSLMATLGGDGVQRGETMMRAADGRVLPVLLSLSRVRDENGNVAHYVAAFTDMSHIKESQARLDHLAYHDPLTGLPNRLLLNEHLEHAILREERQHEGFALVFLDLDNFKHINDSLGHAVGDGVLCEVATRLRAAVRQSDTVARIGGDEFVLLLEGISAPEQAANLASKLMDSLSAPMTLEAREIRVQASIGICMFPDDGDDAQTLLRNADAAMFRAKDRGRNTYDFYTEELTRNAFERLLLENNLRQAVHRGEFALVFQPQIDLQSGSIVGVEALVRWSHPELGVVSPARFIPLAEETGLIEEIGDWVLRAAVRQAKDWATRGIPFGCVGVNVAGAQMMRGRLPMDVGEVLEEAGLPASCLELELTEGFIMQRVGDAVSQLDRLRELGVCLSIDDFGTGYSSLSYLKRLPISRLKIDKSFVQDIPDDPNDMAIASAVISMGRSLGLRVIAEGVETEAQRDFLRENACHEVQGYLYSKPLPADEYEQFAVRYA